MADDAVREKVVTETVISGTNSIQLADLVLAYEGTVKRLVESAKQPTFTGGWVGAAR